MIRTAAGVATGTRFGTATRRLWKSTKCGRVCAVTRGIRTVKVRETRAPAVWDTRKQWRPPPRHPRHLNRIHLRHRRHRLRPRLRSPIPLKMRNRRQKKRRRPRCRRHPLRVRLRFVGVDIHTLRMSAMPEVGIETGRVRGVLRRIRTARTILRPVKGVVGIPRIRQRPRHPLLRQKHLRRHLQKRRQKHPHRRTTMRIPTMHRMPHLYPRRPDSPVVISAPHQALIANKRVVPPIAPVSPRISISAYIRHIRIPHQHRHRHRHHRRRLPVVPRLGQGAPPMSPRRRRIKSRVREDIVIGRVAQRTHGIKTALARDAAKRIRTAATPRQPVKAANGIRRPRRSCWLRVVLRPGQVAPANSPRRQSIKSRVREDIVIGRVAQRTRGIKTALARDAAKRIRTVATPRQRVKAADGTRSESR